MSDVDADEIVEDGEFVNGASIDWSGLASYGVLSTISAFLMGYVGMILTVGEQAIRFPTEMGRWLGQLISSFFGIFPEMASTARVEFASYLDPFGPVAFVLSIAAVVAILLAVQWGVQRL